MQEMTDAWVDWYMAFLDRQPCRFFYSSNFFTNPLASMKEGHNSWSPRPSAQWGLMHSSIELGTRNSAMMLFRKGTDHCRPAMPDGQGASAWLWHLDVARDNEEAKLRAALDFADRMPFVPKEDMAGRQKPSQAHRAPSR
jgi:hypothetical protein